MLTVHLHQLQFQAQHGLYPGEVQTGNAFEVNLDVEFEVKNEKYDNLKTLISYEDLFQIVQKRMAIASPLLEEIADSIIRKIHHQYRQAKRVTISIYKLNAPIERFNGKVGITLTRTFE